MILIKIDRSTIKRNPHAGETRFRIKGPGKATFVCHGSLPDELKDKAMVTDYDEIQPNLFLTSGQVLNPDDGVEFMKEFMKLRPGVQFNLNVENGWTWQSCLPQAEYFYKFENPIMECENGCKVRFDDIERDWAEDGEGNEVEFERCNICRETNTFPPWIYEKISDVPDEFKRKT